MRENSITVGVQCKLLASKASVFQFPPPIKILEDFRQLPRERDPITKPLMSRNMFFYSTKNTSKHANKEVNVIAGSIIYILIVFECNFRIKPHHHNCPAKQIYNDDDDEAE